MGRYAVPLPAEFSWSPFRVSDAAVRGVGPGRLRRDDLERPVRGVRAPAGADLRVRCRALLLHRPEGMAFSHTTAARLYGIPLPERLRGDDPVHVTVEAPSRAPQIAGVVGHSARRLAPDRRTGLPLTGPEHTWLDLASVLRRTELVAVGDYLLACDLASSESLAHEIESSAGRRGIATARLALPLIRQGAESPAESVFRVLLHDEGLAPPCLNYRIHARDGQFVARVDMAYPDQRLVVEYEGDHHRVERRQWHKDIRRQGALEDLGWRVIRVTASDLADPTDVFTRIRRALVSEW